MVGLLPVAFRVPSDTTALAQGVEIDRREKLNQYIRNEQVRKRQIARGVSPANPPIPTSGQPPPYVAPPPPPLPPAGTDPRNRPGIRGPVSGPPSEVTTAPSTIRPNATGLPRGGRGTGPQANNVPAPTPVAPLSFSRSLPRGGGSTGPGSAPPVVAPPAAPTAATPEASSYVAPPAAPTAATPEASSYASAREAIQHLESRGGKNIPVWKGPKETSSGRWGITDGTAENHGVEGVYAAKLQGLTPGSPEFNAEKAKAAEALLNYYVDIYPNDPARVAMSWRFGTSAGKKWDGTDKGIRKQAKKVPGVDPVEAVSYVRTYEKHVARTVTTSASTSQVADPAVAALTTVAAPAAVDLAAKAGLTQEQREQASQYDMPVDPSKETQAALKVRQTLVDEYMDQLYLGNLTEAFAVKRKITEGDFWLWWLAAFEAAAEANQGDGRRAATLFSRWDTSGTKYQLQPITGKKSYYIWTKAPGEEGFTSTGKEVTYAQIASHIRYTASEEYRKDVEAASVAAQADIESDERKLMTKLAVEAAKGNTQITIQILENQGWTTLGDGTAFKEVNGVVWVFSPQTVFDGPEGETYGPGVTKATQ